MPFGRVPSGGICRLTVEISPSWLEPLDSVVPLAFYVMSYLEESRVTVEQRRRDARSGTGRFCPELLSRSMLVVVGTVESKSRQTRAGLGKPD
jgi:hypothetical protein